jgi:bifunctional enzyme CysN/CysC
MAHGGGLLRLATAGSVDDGKSTLIGRLLYETRQIYEDQYQAVERASYERGADYVNLALLTDGLRAEREQGITIDVAYRHFATPRRRFILADTPGHVQYTRNMVTGASTADLALILLDARRGLTEQSRRHAVLASLLRVPHLALCVNKMDLVDYDQDAFAAIREAFAPLLASLAVRDATFIPISALHGDNVVRRSERTPWYAGPPLLDYLEQVEITRENSTRLRFPVQLVIRPHTPEHADYRGYSGQVLGGAVRPGDEVLVLPSGLRTRVQAVDTYDGPVAAAAPPMNVTLRLADELDVSRGDLLCHPESPPTVSQTVEALACWLAPMPLQPDGRYLLKHTTRTTRALVAGVQYRLDVNTAQPDSAATTLGLNDIGRLALRTTTPLLYDAYARNRATGSFILIDEPTNQTVAAGMLLDPHAERSNGAVGHGAAYLLPSH